MTPKLTKALLIGVPSFMVGTIIIVPTAIALAEANHEDPIPPTPPIPPIETVDITFDAGEGFIKETGIKSITLTVEIGSTYGQLITPDAYLDDSHVFDFWSFDQQTEVPAEYVFNEDKTVYAHYSDHEHEYDIFGVDEETNQMYAICSECHHKHYLTDAELPEYEGKLLVKTASGDFNLSDRTLAEEIVDPLLPDNTSTIYLIYGKYDIGGSSSSTINADVHGILDSKKGKTATINCYTGYPIEMPGINLNIYNCLMEGTLENVGTYYFGLMPTNLACYDCYFLGLQSVYAGDAYFEDCIFDATVFKPFWSEDEQMWRIEYALYVYNQFAEFKDCDFYGKGKAVKIYKDGPINGTYTFTNVNFTWVDEEDESKPLTEDQFKACIEIDSTYQTDEPYYIYHSNLTQHEERSWGGKVDLFHDRSTNSIITEI